MDEFLVIETEEHCFFTIYYRFSHFLKHTVYLR